MEGKKTNKGLVIFLIILLLVFMCISVLLFAGVIKSPMINDSKKTTIITDGDKKSDSNTVSTKTADERYKEYINNLSSSIKKNYVSSHETVSSEYETTTKDCYNRQSFIGGVNKSGYTVAVKSNLELVYTFMGNDESHIADNVVSFYSIHEGNGIYKSLYFITNDGIIHKINLEGYLFENEELKITDLDYKNIIEVKQGSATAGIPIFIDIDGNVITK